MKELRFLKQLAEIILGSMECATNHRLKYEVWCIGHFNRRVFNPYKMFHQTASGFIRFLMNISMGMTEAEFRAMMQRITDRIVEACDSFECDEINEEHQSKSRTKGPNSVS